MARREYVHRSGPYIITTVVDEKGDLVSESFGYDADWERKRHTWRRRSR